MAIRTLLSDKRWKLAIGLAGLLSAGCAAAGPTGKLNDTGMTQCVNATEFTPRCKGTGQDGEYGRDVTARDYSDGSAGFGFIKISATGARLPSNALLWSCVEDTVTGLIWEVKTNDGGFRDKDAFYQYGASGYEGQVNEQGLCGAKDWRIPNVAELQSILLYRPHEDSSTPLAIDSLWFLRTNENPGVYWTSTLNIPERWHWTVDFTTGVIGVANEGNGPVSLPVRVVRNSAGAGPVEPRFEINGAEVMDRQTGLVWRRCAEGYTWDGTTCAGLTPVSGSFQLAIEYAKQQAAATGVAWRMPNVKELISLISYSTVNPAMDPTIFPNTPHVVFATSTPFGTGAYWYVQATTGSSGYWDNSQSGAIRLVRDSTPAISTE